MLDIVASYHVFKFKENLWSKLEKVVKNLILVSFWSVWWVLPLLDVRQFCKLSLYVISKKTYNPNSIKWPKALFWAWFKPVGPKIRTAKFLFKNLASSLTRYHDQLSSDTIPGKTDLILKKDSEGQTNRQKKVLS